MSSCSGELKAVQASDSLEESFSFESASREESEKFPSEVDRKNEGPSRRSDIQITSKSSEGVDRSCVRFIVMLLSNRSMRPWIHFVLLTSA
jgi:hypothetical protein